MYDFARPELPRQPLALQPVHHEERHRQLEAIGDDARFLGSKCYPQCYPEAYLDDAGLGILLVTS